MTQEKFNEFYEKFIGEETKLLTSKGQEYSAQHRDRLSAFKEIADLTGMFNTEVCMVFLLKHITSICKYNNGTATPTTESFMERIHDARNYLFLLAALYKEEQDLNKQEYDNAAN